MSRRFCGGCDILHKGIRQEPIATCHVYWELGPGKSCRLNRSMQHYSALEVPYKQVVFSVRADLASRLQRKGLIFGPFKTRGCQFNTLEKCSVFKFLQAGLRECCDDPLRPPRLPGPSATSAITTELPTIHGLASVRGH